MEIRFDNKTVLITGGTRGIGKNLAESFHRLGAKVIITGTDPNQITILNNANENNKIFFAVDFLNPESVSGFLKNLEKFEKIDILINNAGINRINNIDETLVEDWNDLMSVNLTVPFLLIREISKKMKKNKYGRIINIGSIFGNISKEKRAIYSATKFGIHGITVSISNELSKYNILTNTVSPGFVLTELTKSILKQSEIENLTSMIPAERMAQPEDITSVILFCSSENNTYMTGQNIIIDGGFTNV